jgi:hypothetical protein
MLKYLHKIKLSSETASDGKECIDMVFSKEPGYYSLIIVWKAFSWKARPNQLIRFTVRYSNAREEWLRYLP